MNDATGARLVVLALLACASTAGAASAQSIQRLTIPGINNFWRVDQNVSTGGTITSREMAVPALKRRGIKTVIKPPKPPKSGISNWNRSF